ncbi:MAG: GAF domain-containing protein [Anaerolineales bacterium]|nr:GAF domain-containing protein [Anaerolineales bacterium]
MLRSNTTIFFNDTFNDERINDPTMQMFVKQNIRAAAVLPLFLGTRQVGVLFLEAHEPHEFTPDEIRLFTALSPQIATVLENRIQFEIAQKQAQRESTLNVLVKRSKAPPPWKPCYRSPHASSDTPSARP